MASYQPPDEILSIFNSYNYEYGLSVLSWTDATKIFLQLTGGTLSGNLYAPNIFISGVIGGTLSTASQPNITSMGTLTGLTVSGTSSFTNTTDSSSSITGSVVCSGGVGIAKKLYVGDGIYGTIQTASQTNITSIGSLTGLTLNGVLSSSSNVIDCSSSFRITNGSIPAIGSGGGFRYSGINSTFYISSHNHQLSTHNNIDIQDAVVYIKSNTNVGLFTSNPLAYIDINQQSSASNRLRISYSSGTVYDEVWTDSSAYLNTSNAPPSYDSSTRVATSSFVQSEVLDRTYYLCGFVDITASTISYNSSTRIFTIAPTSSNYIVWVNGVKYTKSTSISTSAHASTIGITYWIYFDNTGTIQIDSSAPDMLSTAMIAIVYYYSSTQYFLLEERHGITMDPATHRHLHNTIGTYYVSGLALSAYNVKPSSPIDTDNRFTSSSGVISDEELRSSISQITGNYTIMSLTGASALWTISYNNQNPFLYSTYISYNQNNAGTWQMTDAGATNKFINYYVLYLPATSASNQMVLIPGQSLFTTLADAQAASFRNLTLTSLLLPEYLSLYKITFGTNASYTTNGKVRIESVQRLSSSLVSNTTNPATDHQSLSNLQIAGTGNTYGHINDSTQTIAGNKTLSGITTVSNTTDATVSTDGALIVSGGVGVAKKLYVGTGIYGTLQTAAQTNITSVGTLTGLTSSGITTVSNTTDSSATTNGALIVSGGVGIAKKLYVGDSINSSAPINITSTTNDGVKITNSSTTGLTDIKFVSNASTWEMGVRGSASTDPVNGFYIYNGSIRFCIDSSGNCGFGGKTGSLIAEIDCNGSINTSADYKVAGSTVNVRALTSITAGTVSASKAIIVDSNRAITNMGSLSIEDSNAFPLNVYNSALTTTNAIGINLGKSAATNESFQMKFNYDTTSTDTSYLSFSPYGQTNSLVIKSNEYIGFKSISNPLWPLHGPNIAQDQVLALYCAAVDSDFYGIGTNTNSMLYQASQTHKFYYGSKGKTSGDGKGTLIAQFDASGLYVERYTSGADASGTYSYLNAVEFKLNEVAPSATYSYSIECAQGVVCNSGGFFARSDLRLKEDIIYYNNEHKQRLIDGVKSLNICSYVMKNDELKKRATGVIAQDVVKSGLGELISFIPCEGLEIEEEMDIKNHALTVQYEKIGLLLIPIVQDLYKKIEVLEEQLSFFTNKEYFV